MKNTINLALVEKLRMLRFDRFKLDGNFFASCHVSPKINVAEGPTPDLPPEPVLLPNTELHFSR